MFSKKMENLKPYVPGEQPKDKNYIKLNANENPYPPPKAVTHAIKKMLGENADKLKLYPDPESVDLKKAYASFLNECGGTLCSPKKLSYKLTDKNIFCGNGSDEVLSFIFYAFFDQENSVIIPEHTYSFYPVYCSFYEIPLKKIPLKTDFTVDIPLMIKESQNSSSIILANPNAPTAIAMTNDELCKILDAYPKDKIFVVDEAYSDFYTESMLQLLPKYENLLIVRTSSKSLSFAGMRLGFAVGHEKLIDALTTVKNSFNHFPCDRIAQTAGIAACGELDYYINNAKKTVDVREKFCTFLKTMGWTFTQSATNFVLAKHPKLTGKMVYEKIKENGILVRFFDILGVSDYVRITIGSAEEMEQLKQIIKSL
ncbi:MAG: histidinol-phosphate transaminase [Treponema sp.]|nr:histidinol-phosphate transaminase [Treponema sp.]